MKSKIIIRFFLSLLLIFPCFLWACFDKSLWSWDPAMYGTTSIQLWRHLIFQPSSYFHDLFTIFGNRAPMICWIGQFFAPLGNWFGYEKSLLFMQVLFSAWMIFEVVRWKIFSSSYLKMLAGALLIASTPFFIFQNQYYFVELLQTFGVLCTFGLYLRRKELSVVHISCAYFALFFFLLGVKVTSPCYIFFPTLGLLYECWIRRSEFSWAKLKNGFTFIWFALAIIFTLTVTIWYATNAASIYAYAKSASGGNIALLYGQKANLIIKFHYWWPQMQNLFWGGRTKIIFEVLIILSFILYWRKIIDQPFCFSIAQVVFVLLPICFQVNQDVRYIYPLLAYWIYIFGRIVTQNKAFFVLFICLFTFRWVEMNLSIFNIWPLETYIFHANSIDRNGIYLNQVNDILKKTVNEKNPQAIAMGVSVRELNGNAMQFKYFTQYHHAIQGYPMVDIDWPPDGLNNQLRNIKSAHAEYLVTLPLAQLKKINFPFSMVSLPLYLALKKQGWHTFATGSHYLILKKPEK